MTPPAALQGLRVLDLTGPMGWYCTKVLADLGADVLRIEPRTGDPGRRNAPLAGNRSLAYEHYNTSKRATVLNLDDPRDRQEFESLARTADVIVETTPPGALDRLGVGYRALSALNPGLVWTAITPFGQNGPRSGWQATDLIGWAMAGQLNLAGNPGSPPSWADGDLAYQQASVVAASGTMVALLERDRSGLGQMVDVSMQESLIIANENNFALFDSMGIIRRRIGQKSFSGPIQVYPCKDGYMVGWLGRRWDQLVGWLEDHGRLPEAWRGPEWKDEAYRFAHNREVDAVMSQLTNSLTREQIYIESQRRRIANGPVATLDEVFRDPQLNGRDFWLDAELDGESPLPARLPGAPYRLSRTPWRLSRPAPSHAQHAGEGWLPRVERQVQPLAKGVAEPAKGPLSGIRAVDFTWQIAGPLTSQLLADHGADVLKVESVVHPDGLRAMLVPRPPWNDSLNQSGIFNMFNTSKRSVSIDLRQPSGLDLLKRLIALADVTVDNYGVDPFPRWGLTPDALRELNPQLVVARSSVMGRTGPRQHFIGFGYSISAAAGLNSHMGFPGDPPVGACIAYPDYSCNPFHLIVAMLAALYYRNRSGEGQWIDLSQHESTVIFNGPALLNYSVNGVVAQPIGNRHPQMAPHGVYPARGEDAWVAIACRTGADWSALCAVIGRPELAADERFATLEARKSNENTLDAEIAAWTRLRKPQEAMQPLQAAGVPAGAAQNMVDLIRDPQLRERKQLVRQEHPELGHTLLNQPGFKLSRTPGKIQRHPVLIGEDTDDILRDLVGLTEEEIAMGYVEGVLQ